MNFSEYLKSDGLNRAYNVIVTPEDCVFFSSVKNDKRYEFEAHLKIGDQVFFYFTRPGFDNTLFCWIKMDQQPGGAVLYCFRPMKKSLLKITHTNRMLITLWVNWPKNPLARLFFQNSHPSLVKNWFEIKKTLFKTRRGLVLFSK